MAQIVGASQTDVESTVGALTSAFTAQNKLSDNVMIAAIATVRVECPPFKPIHEYGTDEYFRRHYDITGNPHVALELGNSQPGDGIKFAGRGFNQLSGRSNYRRYGIRLNIDLENNPDLALRPDISAKIFDLFFEDHGCIVAANNQQWKTVRLAVNGGLNGFNLYQSIIMHLLRENSTVRG